MLHIKMIFNWVMISSCSIWRGAVTISLLCANSYFQLKTIDNCGSFSLSRFNFVFSHWLCVLFLGCATLTFVCSMTWLFLILIVFSDMAQHSCCHNLRFDLFSSVKYILPVFILFLGFKIKRISRFYNLKMNILRARFLFPV